MNPEQLKQKIQYLTVSMTCHWLARCSMSDDLKVVLIRGDVNDVLNRVKDMGELGYRLKGNIQVEYQDPSNPSNNVSVGGIAIATFVPAKKENDGCCDGSCKSD